VKAEARDFQRHYTVFGRITAHVHTALRQLVARYCADRTARVIIVGLALVNLTIIFLHVLNYALNYFDFEHEYEFLRQHYFNLSKDRGYAEIFNYLQATVCAALLFGAFVASGQRVHAAWALVFAFVVMDDALSIHERIGRYLGTTFVLPTLPGLRPQDTGELVVWGAAGAFLLPVLVWGFRSSSPEAVGFGGVFALAFALLVFFGAGVDMLHVAFETAWPGAYLLFMVVEDGGEMLAVALACAAALLLYRRSTAAPDAGVERSAEISN
jgi:hypothetical protein